MSVFTLGNLFFKLNVRCSITHSGQSEIIKNLCAIFPGICVSVFLLAFVVKTIHLCNLSAFVISSQKSDLVGIPATWYEKNNNNK